jgi:hypothetical protein
MLSLSCSVNARSCFCTRALLLTFFPPRSTRCFSHTSRIIHTQRHTLPHQPTLTHTHSQSDPKHGDALLTKAGTVKSKTTVSTLTGKEAGGQVKVYLMDGSFRTLQSTALTTTEELKASLLRDVARKYAGRNSEIADRIRSRAHELQIFEARTPSRVCVACVCYVPCFPLFT